MALSTYPKFRWYVLLTMLVVTLSQGIALISPAPLVGEIAKSLNLSLGEATGSTMGAFIVFVAISGMVGGVITDRIGVIRVYIISIVLMAIGAILTPVIGNSLPGLLFARVIQGCGAGPIMSSISKLAADWFPKKERPLVTGVQGMSLSLGIAFGFGLIPTVYEATSDWQFAIASTAFIMTVGLIMTLVLLVLHKTPFALINKQNRGDEIESANDFRNTLKLSVFWAGVLSAFFQAWAMQGYNDLTPGHLAVDPPVGLGYGAVLAGRYMGLLQLAFMVGSITSGFITTKIFKQDARKTISLSFFLTGIFCTAVLLPTVYENPTLLLIDLILAGFFMGMPTPAVMAFIANSYPEHITGRVGGMTMGLGIFGGTAGVAVGSAALHYSGLYTISILIVSSICLLGTINAWGIRRPTKLKGVFRRNEGSTRSPEMATD